MHHVSVDAYCCGYPSSLQHQSCGAGCQVFEAEWVSTPALLSSDFYDFKVVSCSSLQQLTTLKSDFIHTFYTLFFQNSRAWKSLFNMEIWIVPATQRSVQSWCICMNLNWVFISNKEWRYLLYLIKLRLGVLQPRLNTLEQAYTHRPGMTPSV